MNGRPNVEQIVSKIPAIQKPSGWQMWMTAAIVLLLCDHVGIFDIDGWFQTGRMTPQDLTAMIAAVGATLSMFSRGRRQS